MSVRITAPVAGLNGTGVGGLQFENSIAETDNQAIIDYCIAQGYTVEPITDDGKPAGLDELTIAQLDELAAVEEIDLKGHKASKQTRVDAIEAARKAKAEQEQQDALDHTYVVTYKDAAGDEVKVDYIGRDVDQVREAFGSAEEYLGAEILTVDEKLTGEPTEQA
ncbi:hypothetical protein [Aeromicrobium sp. 9AM]|uniref:hypothetical protein n=1 Tax=Aeromicrobium sp. 9AM TaxID=2653126 RepID=UPI0012F42DAE|nr:hypothetical protein [Aeromicrobium sp. 9AM]VXB82175.1 hypothetical protein AERO9AM_20987 [Aeromicrobium sp. 9AM]